MPESYNKDAYEVIYQHKDWKETASNYEKNFARNLSRAPVVQDAARGALVRMSNMLNAYYGIQDKKKENAGKMLGGSFKMMADTKALEEVASDVAGTTPTITRTLEEALLPDMEQEGSGAEGYVDNAYRDYYRNSKEASAEGMHVLPTRAAMKAASDLNQANLENVINGEGSLEQRMWLIYNGVSNTGGRDAYTASNSRTVQNMLRGMQKDNSLQMRDIGLMSGNQDLIQSNAKMDYESFQRLENESASGPEIFERAALERPARKAAQKQGLLNETAQAGAVPGGAALTNAFPSEAAVEEITPSQSLGSSGKKEGRFSRFISYLRRKMGRGQKESSQESMPQGQENTQAQEAAAAPEQLPETAQAPAVTGLPQQENGQENPHPQAASPAEEEKLAPGMLKSADPSVTTLRLLGAYRMLGAGKRDLLFFRLALIAWMVKGKENSLYDILEASHKAGLKGSEDISEAATMYTSLDPLTASQLRAYAPDNRFPHETIYLTMLNEVKQKRKEATSASDKHAVMFNNLAPKDHTAGTDEYDALSYDAQEMALNLYTSPAYQVMNAGARNENMEDARSLLEELPDEQTYWGSNSMEQADPKLMDQVFDVIRVSSRLSQDALTMRGAELSDQKNEELSEDRDAVLMGDETQSSQGRAAYRGVTYRGGGMWKDLQDGAGGTFVTGSLTSTTQDAAIAAQFYDMSASENRAIVRYHLAGKGAVRVSDMSVYEQEAEVLVPIGTKFSIRHELAPAFYKTGSVHQIKYKENLTAGEQAEIENQGDVPQRWFDELPSGIWVQVQMIELDEVSGPGEQRREQLEKGQNKNKKKALELEKYRRQMSGRQAGAAG
ncbi:MAG: hypothetical protein LUH19_04230 [Lachnospiraceae bacterium]|nr:hypothetical protein [Lachnospiraceae bacterium]